MEDYIEDLRSKGIISHIQNNPVNRDNGIILIACGDCDRFDELYEFEKSLFRKSGLNPRIHLLALNGGGLLVHPKSPLNDDFSSSQTLLFHSKNSSPLKEIHEVVMYSHDPCGAAAGSQLSIRDSFKWLAGGAAYLGNTLKNLNITCNFHLECNTDTKFKSEYFDYLKWIKNNSALAVTA